MFHVEQTTPALPLGLNRPQTRFHELSWVGTDSASGLPLRKLVGYTHTIDDYSFPLSLLIKSQASLHFPL